MSVCFTSVGLQYEAVMEMKLEAFANPFLSPHSSGSSHLLLVWHQKNCSGSSGGGMTIIQLNGLKCIFTTQTPPTVQSFHSRFHSQLRMFVIRPVDGCRVASCAAGRKVKLGDTVTGRATRSRAGGASRRHLFALRDSMRFPLLQISSLLVKWGETSAVFVGTGARAGRRGEGIGCCGMPSFRHFVVRFSHCLGFRPAPCSCLAFPPSAPLSHQSVSVRRSRVPACRFHKQ